MNPTQQWLNAYYSNLQTLDSKEAVSTLKQFLNKSIKEFDFDELEYLLDHIDMDAVPVEYLKVIIKTLKPYNSEFEFWDEFVAEVEKKGY
jgi:hypothetical protein